MIIKSMNNKFMFFPTGENDDSVNQKLTTKESRIVKTLMFIGMFGGVIWIIISDYLPSPGTDDLLPSINISRRPGCVVPIVRPLPPKSPAVHALEVTVTESR